MPDPFQLSEPLALYPLFQHLRLGGFLPGPEGLKEQEGVPHQVLSLLPIGLLVVAEKKGQVPGGQVRLGKVRTKHLPMLGHCARNRGDDPGGRPGGNRPLADQLQKILRKSVIKSQTPRDPTLFAPQQGGDPALGQMISTVKFPQKSRLLEEIPSTVMSPSQDLHQGLFLFAFPDLGHRRVPPTVPQSLHPQVTID